MENAFDLFYQKMKAFGEAFWLMLPNLAAALLVLALFFLLARLARAFGERSFGRVFRSLQLRRLAATLLGLFVFGIGLFVALGLLNLDKAVVSLLAGLGVVGLALGFALQDVVANFVSGLMLSVRRPFEVGDTIESNGQTGKVKSLDLRTTVLKTPSGQLVSIPNKDIFQSVLVNFSREGERRVDIALGVDYEANLEDVRKVALAAVESFNSSEKQQPKVVFEGFGELGVAVSVRFWVELGKDKLSALDAQSAAVESLKKAFKKAKIEIVFPKFVGK